MKWHPHNCFRGTNPSLTIGFCTNCGDGFAAHHAEDHACPVSIFHPLAGNTEADPHGFNQHAPGAKLDAGKNRLGLIFTGFACALEEVGKVGTYGAAKYTDHGWREVPNGIQRYTDALYRHLLAEFSEGPVDHDTQLRHAAHAAWNALARLELMLAGDRELTGHGNAEVAGAAPGATRL